MEERLESVQITPRTVTAERLISDLVKGQQAMNEARNDQSQKSVGQTLDEARRMLHGTIETALPFFLNKDLKFKRNLASMELFILLDADRLNVLDILESWSLPPKERDSEITQTLDYVVERIKIEKVALDYLIEGLPLYRKSHPQN